MRWIQTEMCNAVSELRGMIACAESHAVRVLIESLKVADPRWKRFDTVRARESTRVAEKSQRIK